MYKAERFAKVFAVNVCLAVMCLCGLVGLLHAFSIASFGALAAGKQMGLIASAVALGGAAVAFTAGAFGALSLGWERLISRSRR